MNHRRAALLLLLLPAACAGAPPKPDAPAVPPAEIFRILEQRLADSTSLRIQARCERIKRAESGTEDRQGVTALCFLRGENQSAVQLRGTDREGRPVGAGIVCDGTRMLSRPHSNTHWIESAAPNSFSIVFRSLLHRIGLVTTTSGLATMIAGNTFPIPSAVPAAANFRSEETKDGVACFSYTVVDLTARESHAKLWYDPQTLRPLRRRVGVEDGQPGLIWEETYEEYTLNAQLPDAPFVLPDVEPSSRFRFASDGKFMIYEEREAGVVRFVLIADDSVEGVTTDDGIALRNGGLTEIIKATKGLMMIKANRTTMKLIPAGWDHDLVQEYYEYRAAHPKGRIVDWLKEALQRRPAPALENYLRQE